MGMSPAGKIRLYHRTDSADVILRDGFRDGEGTYMTTQRWTGVFFSDRPLDCNEGANGSAVIRVVAVEQEIAQYEWIEEEGTYREWCIPAQLANSYPREAIDEYGTVSRCSASRTSVSMKRRHRAPRSPG